MRKTLSVTILIVVVTASFLAGSWYQKKYVFDRGIQGARKVLYYIDPMNPGIKSDKPGIAPCGMPFEPVYADGSPDVSGMPPGTVNVNPDQQQLIGVKVATVEKASRSHIIRVLGRVVPDETRIYRINSASDGWVKRVFPVTTGSLVKKDDVLATFFSSEFFPAMKAYLYGLRSMERFEADAKETQGQIEVANANIDSYRLSLRNLGMSEHQLDEIKRTHKGTDEIEIRAPESGFVIARNISLGQRFERGTERYRIADLSHVWILADIFENEAQFFKPGVVATVSLPNQNRTFRARVSNTLPQFDPASRTLKMRLEAENPDFVLKPDMFVDVELPINYSPTFAVPVDAVVDTGMRKVVFVDKGNGIFEPRRVQTGWRRGGLVEITRGLMDKERIVISGTFMIDSESRMQAAAMGIYDEGVMDPVCGMYIDEKKAKAAGRTIKFAGVAYHFCSPECMRDFDKSPRRYVGASGERLASAAATTTSPTDTHSHHD